MSKQNDLQTQIDDYLSGTMTAEDKLDFEAKLQQNPSWQKELELNRSLHRALKNPKATQLENELKAIGDEFAQQYEQKTASESKDSMRRLNYTTWLVAASVAIVVAVSIWFWMGKAGNLTNQELYANYYEPYAVSTTIRSSDPTIQTDIQQAQEMYRAGNYTAAIQAFEELLQREDLASDDVVSLHYYQGLAHLALDQAERAQTHFREVVQAPANEYSQQTYWYLALSYLQLEDRAAAKEMLSNILENATQGKYFQQAKSLLQDLE